MNKYQLEFPNFEFISKLGSGDSGEVFLAKDKVLDREVAIKIYNANPVYDTFHLQDYKEQVKKIAALNHKNIAQIYYSGVLTDHTPYAIYEYIKGNNLEKYVSEHRWEKLKLLSQLIDGINYAHAKGIIHGDLHEENILINEEGIVKIIDFFGQCCSNTSYSNEDKLLSTGYSLIDDQELVSFLDPAIIKKFKPTSTWVILEELEFLQDRLNDYRDHICVDEVSFTQYFIHDWTTLIAAFPVFKIEKIHEYIKTPINDESCMDVCRFVNDDDFFQSLWSRMNMQISKLGLQRFFDTSLKKNMTISDILDFYNRYQHIVLKNVFSDYFIPKNANSALKK